jgi:hypothetical protein
MECPYCIETIRDESLVCRNCTRDLTLAKPIILEIQEMIAELEASQRELNRVRLKLALIESPGRFLLAQVCIFVLFPGFLLIMTHFLMTFIFDVSSIYLRLASLLIPLPFGFVLAIARNIGFRGAMAFGVALAIVSICGMLAVSAHFDNVAFLPSDWRDWREVLEYGTSIALAFGAGNILALVLFRGLPRSFSSRGRPNAAAYWIAGLMGQHVGGEALRRRARLLQDTFRTVGPLIGLIATASGSIYTGLKGIIGH